MDAVSSATARIPVGGRVILVDREDEIRVRSFNWSLSKAKCGRLYAKNAKAGSLARWLMDAPPGVHVDHKNGNTLDNRRSNLRICTHQQNQWNRKRSPGVSKYKGVTFYLANPRESRWVARIECHGKRHFLGGHRTQLAAALAYDAAAVELFGEYAAPNFPERFRK